MIAARLERLLNDDAEADDSRPCLFDDAGQAGGRFAVREEIIDDDDAIIRREEFLDTVTSFVSCFVKEYTFSTNISSRSVSDFCFLAKMSGTLSSSAVIKPGAMPDDSIVSTFVIRSPS